MWSALRSRIVFSSSSSAAAVTRLQLYPPPRVLSRRPLCSPSINEQHEYKDNCSTATAGEGGGCTAFLDLEEVKKILDDVHADDVRVIPVPKHYDFADHMVIATGRSDWHVRNIAQAILYKAKQKQKGAKRMLLPNVVGQEGGKWVVIDSGRLVIHALDEKARAYYNLEEIWSSATSDADQLEDLKKAFVKIRPKNNSKKRIQAKG